MKNLIKKINKKVILATGRMFMGAYHASKTFNLDNPVVCYQGAVVRTKDRILWQAPIKDEFVFEIINYLKKYNIHTHLYFNDTLYIEDDNKKIMEAYCNGRGTIYEVVSDFNKIKIKDIPKILGVIEDENLMNQIKSELLKKYKGILNIVQSAKTYLEITDVKASKGHALDFLKEYRNLSDDEVIASGDQENDIDMLLHAGIRICVGSNSENLKKVAQYHCKSVESDELADIIERLML